MKNRQIQNKDFYIIKYLIISYHKNIYAQYTDKKEKNNKNNLMKNRQIKNKEKKILIKTTL